MILPTQGKVFKVINIVELKKSIISVSFFDCGGVVYIGTDRKC